MNTQKFLFSFTLIVLSAVLSACASPTPASSTTTPSPPASIATLIPSPQAIGPVQFDWRYKGDLSKDTRLARPHAMAFDAQDNLYVADANNERIQKVDRDGNFLFKWGSRGTADGQFIFRPGADHTSAIAVDAQGLVLVIDYKGYVQVFDGQGKFLRKWGGGAGSDDGQFVSPRCMALDQQGNVYVADKSDVVSRIQKFDAQGHFLMKWSAATGTTDCLAIDRQNNVYVVNASEYRIEKYDPQWKLLTMWGSQGKGEGQFTEPSGIAVDRQGNVYVGDNRDTYRIEKFDSNGKFLGQWGGWGDGDGQFMFCCTLAIDSQNNIYATDDGANDSIQKFRPRR